MVNDTRFFSERCSIRADKPEFSVRYSRTHVANKRVDQPETALSAAEFSDENDGWHSALFGRSSSAIKASDVDAVRNDRRGFRVELRRARRNDRNSIRAHVGDRLHHIE